MKLPVLSGIKIIKALNKIDFEVGYQTGSHFILRENKEPFRRVTASNHKVVVQETLLFILKQAELSREKFIKLL